MISPRFNVVDVTGLGPPPPPPPPPDKARSSNTTGGQAPAAGMAHAPVATTAGGSSTSSYRTEADQLMHGVNFTTANHWPVRHAKGLLNGPGQNNCFLNCAVQLLRA
uniref:USP domain-containing protein n=1 Tax=Anopheles merus TaxID=30066 RepID=A0A182UX48_ANOME